MHFTFASQIFMTMKRMYPFFFLLTFFNWLSCSTDSPIQGTLQQPADSPWADMVYLIQPRSLDEIAGSFTGLILDSAAVQSDGSFTFKKMPDAAQATLFELAVQKKGERFPNRLLNDNPETDNYFPFLWKNGDMLQLSAEAAQFQRSFSIKNPGPENESLLKLRDDRLRAFQIFQKEFGQEEDASLLMERDAAWLKYQQVCMDYAATVDELLQGMVAFRWVSPEKDYERIPEFLFSQCEKWKAAYPDHPWVAQLCEKTDPAQLAIMKGDLLPDTDLPLFSGKTTTLKAQLGGRLTIVDFWASWCAACRRENRQVLVPLWEKFHDQGFQIIGYALEGNRSAWEKAIEKDGVARWVNASHLEGDDSPWMESLRISTIPANFVLDDQGKIIAKNLHGAALEQFVEEWLGK